jgi:hypothetical protein
MQKQALYSQMSPQYYQYGQTSPSPGTPQPYNYHQIGFTTNPRAGLQSPHLGAQSPYIQQPTALIDPSFITPVPSSLHSLQLQTPPNPRAPVTPPASESQAAESLQEKEPSAEGAET